MVIILYIREWISVVGSIPPTSLEVVFSIGRAATEGYEEEELMFAVKDNNVVRRQNNVIQLPLLHRTVLWTA